MVGCGEASQGLVAHRDTTYYPPSGSRVAMNKTLTYFLLVAVLTGPVGVVVWFVLPWLNAQSEEKTND
jgi:hypothetical protein